MLKNMKIEEKLAMTFISVEAISSVAGIVGLAKIYKMDVDYSSTLTDYGFSQGDIGGVNADFNNSCSTLKGIILYSDQESIQKTSDKLNKLNTKISQSLADIEKTMASGKEISC